MLEDYLKLEFLCRNVGESVIANLIYNLCTIVVYSVVIYLWYWLFWKPYGFFKDFSDYGFEDVNESYRNYNDISKKNVINRLRKQRKMGDLPPRYPNGWYFILESAELPRKKVKEVNVLGQNLVAWRGESGKAYVTDAYCPHLGAHLGVGGKVSKECITCPFHGWQFNGPNGHLVNVPYSKVSENLASLKTKRIEERNGFIFMWFHAEDAEPSWFPDSIPKVESGEWVYRGKTEFRVACHIQEIQENAADLNHLYPVHSAIVESGIVAKLFSWLGIKYSFSLDTEWKPLENENHKSLLNLGINQLLFNSTTVFSIREQSTLYGPGIVYLDFFTPMGQAIVFTMMTPVEPHLIKLTHHLYSSRTLIHPMAKLILHLETEMISRDVRIWNRKCFLKSPLLPKEDANLKKYRLWFKQFYSENSSREYFVKGDDHDVLKVMQ